MRDGRGRSPGRGQLPPSAATRIVRVLLAMFVLTAVVLVGRPISPAAAQEAQATVELTRLSPGVVRPDSTIVFEGKVTNVSDRPLVRLQASIWRSLAPISNRSELELAAESPATVPEGERMYSSDTPEAFQDLYTAEDPNLEPGESKTFRLEADAEAFFFPNTPESAVYLAGVHIREDGITTVGRCRTYLPVQASEETGLMPGQQPVGTATLVRLGSTPSMTREGVFADDHLAEEVGSGGRLEQLLAAAELPGSSYAVDPNLIAELRSMRSGYQVMDSDGKRVAGKGQQAAAAWLTRFARIQADHDGFRLPYGDPDLAALAREDRRDLMQAGQRAAEGVPETKALPLLVAPADGAANRATMQAAGDLGAAAVLLADNTTGGETTVLQGNVGPTILSYRTGSETGPGPDPRDTAVQLRQASLADTYIDSISGAAADSLVRLRLIDQADSAAGASESAPWLRERDVTSLLDSEPVPLKDRLEYPDSAAKAELTKRQLNRITTLQDDLTTYRNLAAQQRGLDKLSDQLLARATSSAWRDHGRAMNNYVDAQELLLTDADGRPASIADLADGDLVRVEGNPQVTLTGSSGQIPVTVVNRLSIPIQVQVLAESPNRSRLRLDNVPVKDVGTVAADSAAPTQVMAHADANGTLPVTISLATPESDPIGADLTVRVNATQAGRVGWVIAVAAGIVLLTTVVLRIRQVARERGADDENPDADQSDPDETDTEPPSAGGGSAGVARHAAEDDLTGNGAPRG